MPWGTQNMPPKKNLSRGSLSNWCDADADTDRPPHTTGGGGGRHKYFLTPDCIYRSSRFLVGYECCIETSLKCDIKYYLTRGYIYRSSRFLVGYECWQVQRLDPNSPVWPGSSFFSGTSLFLMQC